MPSSSNTISVTGLQSLVERVGPRWTKLSDENSIVCPYSDWTVTFEGPSRVESYAVHRCIVGPPFEYFQRLFQSSAFVESQAKSCRIDVSNVAPEGFTFLMEGFQYLLDNCYCSLPSEEVVSIPTLASLLCFCDYFQAVPCTRFIEGTENALKENLSESTVGAYCEFIKSVRGGPFSIELIHNLVIELVMKNPLYLSELHSCSCGLNSIFDIPFWQAIIEKMKVQPLDKEHWDVCEAWSENVACFLSRQINDKNMTTQRKDSNKELFEIFDYFFTNGDVLSRLSENAALRILKCDDYFTRTTGGDDAEVIEGHDMNNDLIEYNRDKKWNTTQIQQRCIQALTESDWDGVDMEGVYDDIENIDNPIVLRCMLVGTVSCIQSLKDSLEVTKNDYNRLKESFDVQRRQKGRIEHERDVFSDVLDSNNIDVDLDDYEYISD
jgi:hypothetical protein